LQYPRTDGFCLWKWRVIVGYNDQLLISITYPLQLEVVNVRRIGRIYQCRFTFDNNVDEVKDRSLNVIKLKIETAVTRYALVMSYRINEVGIDCLKQLVFPCMQGPFKNAWIINHGWPVDKRFGGSVETTLSFTIERVRYKDYFIVVSGEIRYNSKIITIQCKDCTSSAFQEFMFHFGQETYLQYYIQSTLDTYGMLDRIIREYPIYDKNVVTYDINNQTREIKEWNDVILSTIQFPATNGDFGYQWVVSDRVFDDLHRFPDVPEQYKYLSITLKSPYYRNVMFISSTGDENYNVAYREMRVIPFTITQRTGPEDLRQCIRATLQTYEKHITVKDTTPVGASAWDCLSRIADVVAALSRP
jgi:hypothetical protein